MTTGARLRFRGGRNNTIHCAVVGRVNHNKSYVICSTACRAGASSLGCMHVGRYCPFGLHVREAGSNDLHTSSTSTSRFRTTRGGFQSSFSLNGNLFCTRKLCSTVAAAVSVCSNGKAACLISAFSPRGALTACHPRSLHMYMALTGRITRVVGQVRGRNFLCLSAGPSGILILSACTAHIRLFSFSSLVQVSTGNRYTSMSPHDIEMSFSGNFTTVRLRVNGIGGLNHRASICNINTLLFCLLFNSAPATTSYRSGTACSCAGYLCTGRRCPSGLFFTLASFFRGTLTGFCLSHCPGVRGIVRTLSEVRTVSSPTGPCVGSGIVATPITAIKQRDRLRTLAR